MKKPIIEIVEGMDGVEAVEFLIDNMHAFVIDESEINKIKAEAIREWAGQAQTYNSAQNRVIHDAYNYANKISRLQSGLTFKFMPYDGVDCSKLNKKQIKCVIDRMEELGAHIHKTADDFSESNPILIWYSSGTCFDYEGSYKNKRLINLNIDDWPQDVLEQGE